MGLINSDSKSAHGSLFFALFLIPFFRPAAINMAPMLSMFKPLFAAWLLLAAVFSIFFFVRRNGRFDSVLTLFLLFVLISGVSTFYNHGNLYKWLTQYAMLLSPFLVLSTLSNDEPFKFLCALFWILAISILLNILSYFVFPSGMYFSEDGTGSWFLGNRNGVEKTCYLAVLVASILDFHYESCEIRNATRTLPVFAVSAFTMVYSGCGTGTFAIFVYGLLLFLGKYKTVRNVFGLPFLISACIVWFLAIVIFRLTDYLPYEEIATLLGKDLTYSTDATFTGRTYIWDYVMESTMRSPLLGLGVQDIVSIDLINECAYDSAHNTWLQIFSYGGFIGVACMCGCFGVAFSKIQHMQNRELAWLFVCVSAAFLVSSMFENMLTFPLATYLALVSFYSRDTSKRSKASSRYGASRGIRQSMTLSRKRLF